MSIFQLACTVYPMLHDQIYHIVSMPLATRSVLIKCCQAQSVPPNNTPLGIMISKLPPYYVKHGFMRTRYTPFSTFHDMQPLIVGPVTSAIILDLCRALPLEQFEIDGAREASWRKEGIKIEEPERKCQINWNPIFDPAKFEEPMLPFLPPNPTMAKYIFAGLHLWKRRLVDRVLLPRHTRKNMSRDTRRCYEEESGISLENTPIFSQEDWLRYYHRTGIKLGGVTEMRQKWYPSGAKPRTYFAQGGYHYSNSALLQDLFTSLVNSMPFTHHITRLLPSRLHLREGNHYRVYDLSTFTSNMAEQRGFVRRLAEFCYGTRVYYLDLRLGIQEADLGDLMTEYYDTCVFHPEVSYERVPGVVLDAERVFVSDHGVASMLGIFGNLMTCTFAHGALMAQTVEKEDLINVAGDDGLVEETSDNSQEIQWSIKTLGECEMSKTFLSSDEGCICLKRPLYEEMGVLKHGFSCIPPSLITFAHYIHDISDPRYSFHSDVVKQPSSFSIVGKDLMRFLRSVHRVAWKCDEVQLSYAAEIASTWTKSAFGYPLDEGRLPHCGDPFFWPCIPTLENFIRRDDPLDLLILRRFNGCATLPVLEITEDENAIPLSSLSVGDTIRRNSSWEMSMACLLGYIEQRNISKVVWGIEAYEYIKRVLTSTEPHVYEYVVVEDISPVLF